MIEVDEINLTDWSFWQRPFAERNEAFRRLREHPELVTFEEPVIEIMPQGPGYKAIVTHADVVEASRRPQDFCSGKGSISIPDMPGDVHEYFGSMIVMDDPRHAKIRRIVSRAFSPRVMMQRFEDQIEIVTTQIIDDLKAGKGTGDFVLDVAARLPLQIICQMMAIPESAYQTVFDASNVILAGNDPEYLPTGDAMGVLGKLLEAGEALQNLVQELSRERRGKEGDDLVSQLVNANIDGESLSDQEMGSFFILLAVAGNETTRNAIAHGLHLFTAFPEQRALLLEDYEANISPAIEEIVRFVSPVIWMRRTATRDTELNGREIKEGEKLVLYYNSANRDEKVFTDPDRFDITRSPNPHVGFGGPGPHFCLGAHLARQEINAMFQRLFTEFPAIKAGTPDRLFSNFINGIKHLPYTLS